LTNLLVTALNKVGVPVASIGDSTRPLALDV
jgi:hypothetical protein